MAARKEVYARDAGERTTLNCTLRQRIPEPVAQHGSGYNVQRAVPCTHHHQGDCEQRERGRLQRHQLSWCE